jgi:two-component system OmpR family response regulator
MHSPTIARQATVLVVDDEPNILELLSAALRMSGFEVHSADTGAAAVSMAALVSPDIVVLDVGLPDYDGFAVAQMLRAGDNEVPVLFLTARAALQDRLAGLAAGGDDYVSKPFSLDEVVLRMRAILRRTRGATPSGEAVAEGGPLRYADLELDEDAHQARRGNRQIFLSPTEFKLLRYLMVNAGRVVSKAQILDRVWNSEFDGKSRIVESYISYLRRKIDSGTPSLIHTLRGVGYTLRLPHELEDPRAAS